MHILVDIGASTLDICSFILHAKDGDDRYELLTAAVHQLGALILYRERVSSVREAVDIHVKALWDLYDPVSPMPDELKVNAPCHNKIAQSIEMNDNKYAALCRKSIWKTLTDLKKRRNPKSPRWRSKMPLFLSGGGSEMNFYHLLVDAVSEELQKSYIDCKGFKSIFLSKPENFEANVDIKMYHRLAVAWGLSYPKTDIGKVCRPGEIKDVEPPPPYVPRKEFVSKDMV